MLPSWTVRYLYTMDNRAKEVMLNVGELSGSIPIHYRESNGSKSHHGHVLSIDDRPTIWLGRNDYQYIDAEDRLPDPIGEEDTIWAVDKAHQASFAYLPYLVSGERYFLEEMYYWAAYNLGSSNFSSASYGRNSSLGLLRDQVRGEAWALRNIVDAAILATDEDTLEKGYFHQKIMNNIAAWETEYVHNPLSHPLRIWGYVSCWPQDGGRPDESIIGCENPANSTRTGKGSGINEDVFPVRRMSTQWQDDFVLTSLTHLVEVGYPGQKIQAWLGEQIINRFTHPDTNPYHGANYRFPATHVASVNDAITAPEYPIATWSKAMDSLKKSPTSFANLNTQGYLAIALGALATVVNQEVTQHPQGTSSRTITGAQALDWFKSEVYNAEILQGDPKYILSPRAITIMAVKIMTSSLPSTKVMKAYTEQLQTVGGAPPYSYSLISGSLPQGIQLSSVGKLSGKATQVGNHSFAVKVKDSKNEEDTISLNLVVGGESSILYIVPTGENDR